MMNRQNGTIGHGVLWVLFAVGMVLRGAWISAQAPLLDEAFVASGASGYVNEGHLGLVMWYHPPLRNLVVFLSGEIFGGYSAWGLRFGSVLLGSLTVPALGYLGWGLFRDARAGWLAALFLAIDPLHIALSRLAFQESTTPLFIVLGCLCTVHGIRSERAWLPYLAGLCFGLASASKWHGLFPWLFCALVYFAAPWFSKGPMTWRRAIGRLVLTGAAFGALPVTAYIAVYLPWLLRGHDLVEFGQFQLWLVTRQYIHRATEDVYRTLSHRAYLWFIRPTAWTEFVIHQGRPYLAVAMGNFLVWVLTFPSTWLCARWWMRERRFPLGFVLGVFAVSYLPLVLTTRGIWVFSAPPVIPFAFLLIAWALIRLGAEGTLSPRLLTGYLAAAIIVSALMYPMATMKTLDYDYLKPIAAWYSPHRE